MDSKLVIDVSHWDGDIDIKRWKHDRGCWGVIVKAGGNEDGLGRYTDSRYQQDYNKAKACGLHVGAYYYGVSTDVGEAKRDAEHFVGLLKGHDFDLPVYYDVEDRRQLALGKDRLTAVIKAFCDTVQAKGYKCGVYIQGSGWTEGVHKSQLIDYADWIAAWGSKWPSYAPQGEVGMWQQGSMSLSTGKVAYADVSGNVDCNWCCIDYPAQLGGKAEQPTAGTVESLMRIAYDDLGYSASADPQRGSKAGRYCAELMHEDWLAGPSREIWWCCMWVSMILDKAGVKCPGFPSQNTDLAWNGGAKSRAVAKSDIRRGDILIFDWNFGTTATDHIGFATASPKNGYVNTIEGNVDNAVKEKVRPLSSIRYVIRPLYADAADATEAEVIVKNPTQNGKRLDVDGVGGYNTIYEWQAQMGTHRDGVVSGQDRELYRHFEGIVSVSFGGGGSLLVKAVQERVGDDTADGVWRKSTSSNVQRWLKEHKYDIGKSGIDGSFGHDSVCALQTSLNDKAWSK